MVLVNFETKDSLPAYKGFGIIFPEEETSNLSQVNLLMPKDEDYATYLKNLFWWLSTESLELIKEKVKLVEMSHELCDTNLNTPIPRPIHDVVCVGLNYKDHIEECNRGLGFTPPEQATFFSKRASHIYTHGDTLPSIEKYEDKLDYEVELAVVIGIEGKDIPPEKVKDHILGYAVFNDFSARTVQKATSQWVRGKGMDGLCAMSQGIVLARTVEYPPKRAIKSYVNGDLRQNSTTDEVIYDLDTIISEFSKGTTLEAGDIIITGTPAGVAMGMEKPVYLKKGDVVRCEIEGIGELENIIG